MSDEYVYNEPTGPQLHLLEPADYDFQVTSVNPPYRATSGNYVLPVVLAVGPDRITVHDNPSAGVTKKGDTYDTLGQFLKSCGRNPKTGERPNLSPGHLVGARGAVHIKNEVAEQGKLAGQLVNKVGYYLYEVDRKAGDAMPPDVPRSKPGDGRAIVPPPPAKPAAKDPVDIPW